MRAIAGLMPCLEVVHMRLRCRCMCVGTATGRARMHMRQLLVRRDTLRQRTEVVCMGVVGAAGSGAHKATEGTDGKHITRTAKESSRAVSETR